MGLEKEKIALKKISKSQLGDGPSSALNSLRFRDRQNFVQTRSGLGVLPQTALHQPPEILRITRGNSRWGVPFHHIVQRREHVRALDSVRRP